MRKIGALRRRCGRHRNEVGYIAAINSRPHLGNVDDNNLGDYERQRADNEHEQHGEKIKYGR